MKRKICLLLLVLVAVSVTVCGCNEPVVHITLSDGTYEFADNNGAARIEFDLWDKTKSKVGSFCYTAGTAQVIEGPIEIEKGYVIGTSEGDNAKYTFEITDENTITFVLKKSSALYMADGVTPIADGTKFVYADER